MRTRYLLPFLLAPLSLGASPIGTAYAQSPPESAPSLPAAEATRRLDGITFAGKPSMLYVLVREAASALGWRIRWEAGSRTLYLNDQAVHTLRQKRLPDGRLLVAVGDLEPLGARVTWDPGRRVGIVTDDGHAFTVQKGAKRVEIDRTQQQLRAWQGNTLVLQTRVSTGRAGKRTPRGTFAAGPYKARRHYSRLYDNAPMPWSVQVVGNIFIHGYAHVPGRPVSHGCIRVPVTGNNPAKWFYHWISRGTPIHITGRWPGRA
jgi:lipoprotein-anchoring transpeptidase ErfK/SrfK